MSIGFRMTVFSVPAHSRIKPRHQFDCFPLEDQMEAETVAFGYRARALVFEQRVRRPLAIRDMRRVVNGERRSRATKALTAAFVPLTSDRDAVRTEGGSNRSAKPTH